MRGRGFLRGVALAGVDQALLSALSLGAAGLFIGFSSKEAYGVYSLVAGLVLLGTGVQAALVTMPLTALGARMDPPERRRFVEAAFHLQTLLALVCGVVMGLVVAVRGGAPWLAVGACVALLGGWMREFLRTVAFLDERPVHALAGDTVYVALAAAGLLASVWITGTLGAAPALALVGAAALVPGPGLIGFLRRGRARLERGALRRTTSLLVLHGRWTLPGMAVTWGGNSGYAYVVALMLGPEPVAELAAARLFVMPLNLIVAAWNRAFLPRAGACVGRGDQAGLRSLCRRSTWLLGGGSLGWIALVALFFAAGGERLLPARYQGIAALVAGWCVFALANALRNVASVALLAHAAFRLLFLLSAAAAAVTLLSVVALLGRLGALGAAAGLATGEVLLALLAWRALARLSRQGAGRSALDLTREPAPGIAHA